MIKYIVLLFFINFSYSSLTNKPNENDCSLLLEQIGAVDFVLGDNKNNVLNKFDNISLVESNLFQNDLVEEYYEFDKRIVLSNGLNSNIKGIIGFKNDILIFLNIEFYIGRDFNYYFNDVINIFKENNINEFLYKEPKFFNNERTNSCSKLFTISRGSVYGDYYVKAKYSLLEI